MTTTNLSDAEVHLSNGVNAADDTHERIMIITNGESAAVLIGCDDFDSIPATVELLSDPDVLANLEASKISSKQGGPAVSTFVSDDERPTARTRRAWFGGTDDSWTRREVPVPSPGPIELLVRTEGVALNNADAEMAKPGEPFLAGFEVSGVVVAVGSPELRSYLGTRVAGTCPGTLAEYVAIDHRWVLPVPDSLGPAEAAALPTALLTEHGALGAAGFGPGDDVLVTGGTASIGLVGIQVARELGASRIVATTRSAAKRDLLRRVGADEVVLTDRDTSLADALRDAPVDVVLDHVGGSTTAACLEVTRAGGTVVNVGRLAGPTTELDLTALARSGVTVRAVSYGFADPDQIGHVLAAADAALASAVAGGRVRPVLDRVYDFAAAGDALERLRSGRAEGKIVVTFDRS